ncbi:MAG: 3'-5' exonuclease [Christensenellaceae bacterium]|jgi:DNA polymerase III epsilon subunit-like protein|nr:3'-5' exonuclease [Christensenellaceae bacterium]
MNILSFDIESCNGDNSNASMCSFGYCLSDENFNILKQEDILINPFPKGFNLGQYGKEPAIKLAYPESVFRSSPKFPDVYNKILALFNSNVLVIGFAIENDIRFLNNACDVYNLPRIEFNYIDMQLLIKIYKKTRSDISLITAINEYSSEPTVQLHRSDEDARMTLILARNYCQLTGYSLFEIVADPKINIGINSIEEHRYFSSRDYFDTKKGFALTKKMKAILFAEFCKHSLNKFLNTEENAILHGKTVGIYEKLLHDDLVVGRNLMVAILSLGANYSQRLSKCNMIICRDNEDENESALLRTIKKARKKHPIELLPISKFIDIYGEVPEIDIDDANVLFNYYSVLIKNDLSFLDDKASIKKRIKDIRHNLCKDK